APAYGEYAAKLAAIDKEKLAKHKEVHAGVLRLLADEKRAEDQAGRKEAAEAIQAAIKQLEKDRPGVIRGNAAIKASQRILLAAEQEAHVKLVQQFDQAVTRTRNGNLSAKSKEATLQILKDEKKRFEATGVVPWSEAMRPAMLAYLQ